MYTFLFHISQHSQWVLLKLQRQIVSTTPTRNYLIYLTFNWLIDVHLDRECCCGSLMWSLRTFYFIFLWNLTASWKEAWKLALRRVLSPSRAPRVSDKHFFSHEINIKTFLKCVLWLAKSRLATSQSLLSCKFRHWISCVDKM